MEDENERMLAGIPEIGKSKILKLFWEFFTKIINIPGIIRKKTYGGVMFKSNTKPNK